MSLTTATATTTRPTVAPSAATTKRKKLSAMSQTKQPLRQALKLFPKWVPRVFDELPLHFLLMCREVCANIIKAEASWDDQGDRHPYLKGIIWRYPDLLALIPEKYQLSLIRNSEDKVHKDFKNKPFLAKHSLSRSDADKFKQRFENYVNANSSKLSAGMMISLKNIIRCLTTNVPESNIEVKPDEDVGDTTDDDDTPSVPSKPAQVVRAPQVAPQVDPSKPTVPQPKLIHGTFYVRGGQYTGWYFEDEQGERIRHGQGTTNTEDSCSCH